MEDLKEALAEMAVSSTEGDNKPLLLLRNGQSYRVEDVERPDWADGLLVCRLVEGGWLYIDPAALVGILEDATASVPPG